MKGLILDLRNNPGGALPAAIDMADMFLESGDILSVRPRKGRSRTWTAKARGTLPDFPMVVMVNGDSASASEIVSGALQDNGRAKVIGTRSFGKGSVQEVRELDFNRGTPKYTNAYYYLPSGRNLNRDDDSETWGVDPDPGLVIPETDEAYVERILARRPFEIIRDLDESVTDCHDEDWIRENFKDEQLALAIEVISERVSTGEWITVTEEDPALVAMDLETQRLNRARAQLLQRIEEIDGMIAQNLDTALAKGKEPLLPEDVELTAGTITVRDKDDNVVGEFRIDGGDIELALFNLDLTPVDFAKIERPEMKDE